MIEVAKKAALEAGEVIVSYRGKKLGVKEKKRLGDFATDADLAAEEIILKRLKRQFPKHNFISEELGNINKGSEYTWVIDPLDGTIPFSIGLPTFGVSIGLLREDVTALGVINLPLSHSLFWAEKGKGSFLNGDRIKVSNISELSKSVVGFEFAYMGDRVDELEKLLKPLIDKVRYPPVLGTTVGGLAYVAKGTLAAYLHSAHPWDFVAGSVIVEEAGGKVTDYKGKSIDWSKDWINFFASNGHLHDKILSLIKA